MVQNQAGTGQPTRERLKRHQNESNQEQQENPEQKQRKRLREYSSRRVPILVRLLIVLVLVVIALVVGAMVGYATFGGGEAMDVLKIETWTRITDFWMKA
ncbi:DNA-directed RNA polymerase subunit beta [Exiguobacterium sp. s193]|uniref:DNA-directed RNA polymerase subunit beta n=1 Tax=Exiguobacterium sp. s193 TaxID=2751207 RepID=UPI001BEA76E9|nr:DNA-directed RNA polymerase subunit beta [Exiguobacterium sp. s193]